MRQVERATRFAFCVAVLTAIVSVLHAAPGDVDLSFEPASGIDDVVRAVAIQADGKLLIGGEFLSVRGLARAGIARLNTDGTGDPTFKAELGPAAWIYGSLAEAILLQPDGKILVAGGFKTVNGQLLHGIARLNSDGSLDRTFNPGTGISAPGSGPDEPAVTSLALQSDGKILILGTFTYVNDVARPSIARLNPDGSLDSTFSFNGYAESAMALQPDGKIILGGHRLNTDGSVDPTYNPARPTSVTSIALQPDGKVIVSGGEIDTTFH